MNKIVFELIKQNIFQYNFNYNKYPPNRLQFYDIMIIVELNSNIKGVKNNSSFLFLDFQVIPILLLLDIRNWKTKALIKVPTPLNPFSYKCVFF